MLAHKYNRHPTKLRTDDTACLLGHFCTSKFITDITQIQDRLEQHNSDRDTAHDNGISKPSAQK